ncbi:MAG: GGDEF domain-containing protein [Actinomycetota bacterium]|nr:GGDEF domain-containing protein [Actinomycetota bacterium]
MPRSILTNGQSASEISPEQISRRYHLIRVVVTIAVIGAVTLLIGLAALIDPENDHPFKYLAGCVLVAIVSGVLLLILRRPNLSVTAVDITIFAGVSATFVNTIYGGLLGIDPWWQVCAYLVVIMIAGGVSIRRLTTFSVFLVAALASWILVIRGQDLASTFVFDSYVVMALGAAVAGAILLLFRTERRRVTALNRELLSNATHDALTGILNRIGLVKALGEPRSAGMNAEWAAYIDVDYFKSINDRRGHDHGDEVLRRVAAALAELAGESSLAARWGGDEFVLVGSGKEPVETALEAKVNSRINEIEPGATVSVGVSGRPEGRSTNLVELLKLADSRMYERRNRARTLRVSAAG